MTKRILIIGSSMAMPRMEVPYEETWIYKLKKHFNDYDIIDKSRRASTSRRLVSEGGGYKNIKKGADLLEHYNPDIIITQIGITDCAPRLFREDNILIKLINRLPNIITKEMWKIIKKYKKRKPENAFILPYDFENFFENYIQRAKKINSKVITLFISQPSKYLLQKNYQIEQSINIYNQILLRLSNKYDNIITLESFNKKNIQKFAIDEFHVDKFGHKCVFEKLKNHL